MEIFEQICDIIKEDMQLDEDIDFTEDMTFEEIDLDSLDVADAIMSIEDVFEIQIEDEELDGIRTLGELAEIVKVKKGI